MNKIPVKELVLSNYKKITISKNVSKDLENISNNKCNNNKKEKTQKEQFIKESSVTVVMLSQSSVIDSNVKSALILISAKNVFQQKAQNMPISSPAFPNPKDTALTLPMYSKPYKDSKNLNKKLNSKTKPLKQK